MIRGRDDCSRGRRRSCDDFRLVRPSSRDHGRTNHLGIRGRSTTRESRRRRGHCLWRIPGFASDVSESSRRQILCGVASPALAQHFLFLFLFLRTGRY
ncbi:hypothetical protein AAC387_Pa06g1599 [Persea americana]